MNRTSSNRSFAQAWLLRTRVCVAGMLGASLLGSCAVGQGLDGAPMPVGIDVTLTTIDAFGATGGATVLPHGGSEQLGYVSAVAASGGFIYIVDSMSSAVVRLDPARTEVRVLHPLKDANTRGLHVSVDQVIEVVDRYNRAVVELDQSGWERRRFTDSRLIPAPVDVTQTNWGSTVLIADEVSQRLATFDAMANPTGLLTTTLSPVAVAASITAIAASADSVFVLDAASREVTQLDLNGRAVATYGEDALLAPVALAVDECQRIFVADGHPDGLLVSSPEFFGSSARAALPPQLVPAVTDLWIDGNTLYVGAGNQGVYIMAVDPPCLGP